MRPYGKVVSSLILSSVPSKKSQNIHIFAEIYGYVFPLQPIPLLLLVHNPKYQSFTFICLSTMNSPVFPGLDGIYCK